MKRQRFTFPAARSYGTEKSLAERNASYAKKAEICDYCKMLLPTSLRRSRADSKAPFIFVNWTELVYWNGSRQPHSSSCGADVKSGSTLQCVRPLPSFFGGAGRPAGGGGRPAPPLLAGAAQRHLTRSDVIEDEIGHYPLVGLPRPGPRPGRRPPARPAPATAGG